MTTGSEGKSGASIEPTQDALFGGRLTLWQPGRGRGYRFNLDPVLLAGFAPPCEHVLDLGAGCGVLGLSLLHLARATRLTAVEIQPELADLCRRNVAANNWAKRCQVIEGDLRTVDLPQADAVVCNPPYFPMGQGRRPPVSGRSLGRHELTATLGDFIGRGLELVREGGPVCVTIRAEREAEAGELFERHGAGVVRKRAVVPRLGGEATHVLLEGRAGGPFVRPLVEPALVVHRGPGREFSAEVAGLLGERG